jgi:hypothetical protein
MFVQIRGSGGAASQLLDERRYEETKDLRSCQIANFTMAILTLARTTAAWWPGTLTCMDLYIETQGHCTGRYPLQLHDLNCRYAETNGKLF